MSSMQVLPGPHDGPSKLLWSVLVCHHIKVIEATEDFAEGVGTFLGKYIFAGELIVLKLEY